MLEPWSVPPSVRASIRLSVCLSVRPQRHLKNSRKQEIMIALTTDLKTLRPSVHMSVCPSVRMSVSIFEKTPKLPEIIRKWITGGNDISFYLSHQSNHCYDYHYRHHHLGHHHSPHHRTGCKTASNLLFMQIKIYWSSGKLWISRMGLNFAFWKKSDLS